MKIRNYEKKELITFLMILLLLSEVLVLILLLTIKTEKYLKISGIVIKDNLILVVVNKNERKTLYSNKVLFYDNKRIKYKIVEDRGIVIHKKKEDYYQLLLKFTFKDKKVNDVLEVNFVKGRMRLIEIFKIIWEGD